MTRLEEALAGLRAILHCDCKTRWYHGKLMHADDCEMVRRWLS